MRACVAVVLASYGCRETAVGPITNRVVDVRGVSYTSFASDGFTRGGLRNAVDDLTRQTGNTALAVCVFEYQTSTTSHDIAPNTTGVNPLEGTSSPTTSTLDDIREAVREGRRNGMAIMLKPHVDLYTGQWRALIRPDSAWFAVYAATISKYARLAQEQGIEILCIGDEFVVGTQHAFTPQWRSIIASVKAVYSGRLTYAANWSGAFDAGITLPEYQQVEFWDDLDFVGIDAYFPVTSSTSDPTPSFNDASVMMNGGVQQVAQFVVGLHKSVLLTELGAQSVQGALAQPWNFSLGSAVGAMQDLSVQDLYYKAVIATFGQQSWCAGMFWWNWESVPTNYESTNYTPRNKPAAVTLRSWYHTSSP